MSGRPGIPRLPVPARGGARLGDSTDDDASQGEGDGSNLSAYEQRRDAQIASNRSRMIALGVIDAAEALRLSLPAPPRRRKFTTPRGPAAEAGTLRVT